MFRARLTPSRRLRAGVKLLHLTYASIVLLTGVCDAPHDNPLDPWLGGNLTGRVLNRRATPLAGATVCAPDAGRSCIADSSGRFELAGLPGGNVLVRYAASGFVSESAVVEVARGRIDTTTRYLNGAPVAVGCRISSHVYGQSWPPEPLYFFRFATGATDPDGAVDVESVWVEVPAVGLHQHLAFSPDSLDYRGTVWLSSLPVPHPETLVGQPALFRVQDREAAVSADSVATVYRLMYDPPEPAFPLGGVDTVASDTTFYWHRFDKGYRVSYRCEVVLIVGGGPGGVVMAATTPGPADTSLLVSRSALPAGDCYWTIEAIDDHGNSSRSKEERFHVR